MPEARLKIELGNSRRDAAGCARVYAPAVRHGAASFELEPPDAAEFARRMEAHAATHPWLVARGSDEVAAYAYAAPHRQRAAYQWSAEVSVYVHPIHHRRGVGRALYQALLAVLTAQGFVNAYGGITLPNPASVALHEALGFRRFATYARVGYKSGAWHDVGWWHRTLTEPVTDPQPPLGVEVLVGRGDVGSILARAWQGEES